MTDLLPKLDALNDLLKTLRQGKVDAEDMVLRGGDEYWEGQAEAYGKAIRGIESACAAIIPKPMTDLLPHRDGQEDCITLEPGMAYISPEQVGHWYSPAAVRQMLGAQAAKYEALIYLSFCGVVDFDDRLRAHIRCNDVFVPAADAEELPFECACDVRRIHEKYGLGGVMTWVEKRRNRKPSEAEQFGTSLWSGLYGN